MPKNAHNNPAHIAFEAARLLADHQTLDYGWSRRKAAESLGTSAANSRHLPTYAEIEAAVLEHQAIFMPQGSQLFDDLRKSEALMQQLADYAPRLVGPLSRGITARHATLIIYCFGSAKNLYFNLIDAQLDAESRDVNVRVSKNSKESRPAFSVVLEEREFLLIVLNQSERQHPPLDPVTEKPAYGQSVEEVQRQLSELAQSIS
jgi:hypothetical protein